MTEDTKMTNHTHRAPRPVNTVQLCQSWSAHIDHLDRHLSANRWALSAVTAMLVAFPIARSVIPGILHAIVSHVVVPDAVRAVLNFI
jgi:hypothetical protein